MNGHEVGWLVVLGFLFFFLIFVCLVLGCLGFMAKQILEGVFNGDHFTI